MYLHRNVGRRASGPLPRLLQVSPSLLFVSRGGKVGSSGSGTRQTRARDRAQEAPGPSRTSSRYGLVTVSGRLIVLPFTHGHCHLQMAVALKVIVRGLPEVFAGAR